MKLTNIVILALLVLMAAALSACGQLVGEEAQPETTAVTEPTAEVPPTNVAEESSPLSEAPLEPAAIESLQILAEDQSDGQTAVRVRGILSNNCTQLEEIVSTRDGNEFNLTLRTTQEPGEACAAETVPFEEMIVLDVVGLEAGSYSVNTGDIHVSFELAGEEPAAETVEETAVPATDTPPAAASVSGLVWHDSCVNTADTGNLPAGCILTADDTYLADGLPQGEEGIAGVELSIGEGACPAESTASTLTGNEGAFTFDDLEPGTYCLFVDMTRIQNQSVLGAGSWTSPQDGTPEITVTLEPGDIQETINFGWDYLDLPIADSELVDCTNSIEFVADLNVPDDTSFTAGEAFTKEWLLRNNGTCSWTAGYSIVFVAGDAMSAEETIALERTVAPGDDLEVAIDMVAPEEPGSYLGEWQLADASGEAFGVDGNIDDSFWLQIIALEDVAPTATPAPNSAALGGVVWDDFCINSDPGLGCVENANNSGLFIGDGTYGPGEFALNGVRIGLAEGACPTDGTFPDEGSLLDTTLTGEDGRHRFEGLAEGTYCLFMDALHEEMVDLLIPGNWTWPATGVGQYTILLDPGEQILDLDFGWDYID